MTPITVRPPRGRAARRRPPPVFGVLRAAVLAVDTATNSGWGLGSGGHVDYSGEIDVGPRNFDRLVNTIEVAKTYARVRMLDLVLLLESHRDYVQPGRSASTLFALGAARYAWELGWHKAEQSAGMIARVPPDVWRKLVLGQARRRKGEPEGTINRLEAQLADRLRAEHAGTMGPDERAAVCLCHYGMRAGEVAEVLPRKGPAR